MISGHPASRWGMVFKSVLEVLNILLVLCGSTWQAPCVPEALVQYTCSCMGTPTQQFQSYIMMDLPCVYSTCVVELQLYIILISSRAQKCPSRHRRFCLTGRWQLYIPKRQPTKSSLRNNRTCALRVFVIATRASPIRLRNYLLAGRDPSPPPGHTQGVSDRPC